MCPRAASVCLCVVWVFVRVFACASAVRVRSCASVCVRVGLVLWGGVLRDGVVKRRRSRMVSEKRKRTARRRRVQTRPHRYQFDRGTLLSSAHYHPLCKDSAEPGTHSSCGTVRPDFCACRASLFLSFPFSFFSSFVLFSPRISYSTKNHVLNVKVPGNLT